MTVRLSRPLAVLTLAAVALTACGPNDVTRPRLEAALGPNFANLYVQQAAILGHSGVTVATTRPTVTCDRGGPKVADVGPGADWVCTISFVDDASNPQEAKFELKVMANACFVASGPTKLLGPAKIPDTGGKDVTNPVAEFEGCFNPAH